MTDKAIEVLAWDPVEHTDLPGFAHGLTRYGSHWMDVGISVIRVSIRSRRLTRSSRGCAK